MNGQVKLNLGCGEDHKAEYINVDKFGNPDIFHNLEDFPWPWDDNSVIEVVLKHVLEHLGESTKVYLNIIEELYRICKADAKIEIVVPHPRHDDFIDDPTHVRVVTPASLKLFSKAKNREWVKQGCSNSPLGLYLDVDFEIVNVDWILDPVWAEVLKGKDQELISQAKNRYNNVVKEIQMTIEVKKS